LECLRKSNPTRPIKPLIPMTRLVCRPAYTYHQKRGFGGLRQNCNDTLAVKIGLGHSTSRNKWNKKEF
jgi:hypothetical protein